MKNLISKLSLILFLSTLSVFQLSGKDLLPTYQIKVIESNVFVLEFNNTSSDMSIKIKDASDNILVTKSVAKNKGAYYVKFILSQFEKGTYQLIVEDDTRITSTNLFKTAKWIELDETETILYKPYLKLDGQHLDINLLNMNELEVDIFILDPNDNTLYTHVIYDQKSIHKRFDLSALREGSYIVKITIGDQLFYKNISIK